MDDIHGFAAGCSLLHACTRKNYDKTKDLLARYAIRHKTINEAMLQACINGSVELIVLLIQHGASSFNDGLYWTSLYGHVQCSRMMIEHGATNFQQNFGFVNHPYGYDHAIAYSQNRTKISELILEASFVPICCHDETEICTMLQLGFNINKFANTAERRNIKLQISIFRDAIQTCNAETNLIPPLLNLVCQYSLI